MSTGDQLLSNFDLYTEEQATPNSRTESQAKDGAIE